MSQLTKEQRYEISAFKKAGKKQKDIAKLIGKSEGCISKELRRNCDERNGEYKAELADKKCRKRHKEKPKIQKLTSALKEQINSLLEQEYSPEQICGRLKLKGLDCVSHEIIYQYIWEDKKRNGSLYKHLRSKGKKYRKRGLKKEKRGQIPNRKGIEERPKIVDEKERIGDLEIDLVIGKDHKGALITINDRVAKILKIILVPSKESQVIEKAVIKGLKDWKFIHTITSDNGK